MQKNTTEVVKSFGEISKPLIEWFKDNETKLNADECHLILSDSDINLGNFNIKSIKNEKLLSITKDL